MNLPNVIENPEFQAILAQKLVSFTAAARAEISPDFPEPTPADPSWHHLAELSLTELIIREKNNAAAYAQLIKTSNDLEWIFKTSIRPGESLEAYRDRMRGRKYEAAPAGTTAMYRAQTFLHGEATLGTGKDERKAAVQDCYVENVKGDILIHVLVNSEAADLKTAVIKKLTEAFKDERVKPFLDVVAFTVATSVPFVISGTIKLLPGFGQDYKATIEKAFREKMEAQKRLGWAPSVSWIIRELHQTGVKSLVLKSPSSNVDVQPQRYAAISTLDLTVEVSA
jgi:phage-related baseplate assembly protein